MSGKHTRLKHHETTLGYHEKIPSHYIPFLLQVSNHRAACPGLPHTRRSWHSCPSSPFTFLEMQIVPLLPSGWASQLGALVGQPPRCLWTRFSSCLSWWTSQALAPDRSHTCVICPARAVNKHSETLQEDLRCWWQGSEVLVSFQAVN